MKFVYSFIAFFAVCFAASFASAESPIQPGDRIAIVGNTFADQLRIHGYLESLLLQSSRDNPVSIRNLGWAGDLVTARDRPTNFPTEESTLKSHQTDVIIACFGFGESFGGETRIDEFQANLKAFIDSHAGKKYNGNSEVRLILVSPIAIEDFGALTPEREKRNRELKAYTGAMREVAEEASVPFVDLFSTSLYLMDEANGPSLTRNGIHFNGYGYWAISQTFCDQLMVGDQFSSRDPWRLSIDVKSKASSGNGVSLSQLEISDGGITFLVTEKSAPRLPPPTDQDLPPQLSFDRDTLRVENLDPGAYQLSIDNENVVTATAEAWSEGVPVDSSPAHLAAERYREAVNDKNLQFTYSWKALNQVHIVGERRSSPSGKRLPQEVIEFNDLANHRDANLRKGLSLKTRHWRLSPVEN